MIDPCRPEHPDGPVDADDLPAPLAGASWLEDEDVERDWRSEFSLVTEDPE